MDDLEQNNIELTDQGKTISLFQFIRELNKIKQKAILNVKDCTWHYALSKLPDDPDNIKLNYQDRTDEDNPVDAIAEGNVLLSVHKPEFQKCPAPDEMLIEWLLPGWDDYNKEAEVRKFIAIIPEISEPAATLFDDKSVLPEEEPQGEFFTDNEERVKKYENWLVLRSAWVTKQKITKQTVDLFTDLYRFYFELLREAETKEIIVANGTICDANLPELQHPVLTRRVKMVFNADSNTISIVDTDAQSELYSVPFQTMGDIERSGINKRMEDLQKNDYHPLDRNDTPAFLKILIHQLSSDSYYSDKPVEAGEGRNNRLRLYLDPCFIVRKRLDGTLKAIESIIEDVNKNQEVPKPIRDIVSGGKIEIPEETGEAPVEERLAAVGGESVDILLSKEANKEQLDIAKRIEKYNAVLVQGPPGTGKTHTIANLMGHFLAQGKSILVTSYTKKALSVLKEKVAPGLQDLCVSMLDDSNKDMERSVDGINEYLSKTTSYELKREMDNLAADRRDVIKKLAEVRKKIYAIINKECNCIVLNGEDISPSKAAAFVVEHTDDLSYIPGKVRLYTPLPLSFEQLTALYRSNEGVSASDEKELETNLPNPAEIVSPIDFSTLWEQYQYTLRQLSEIEKSNSWSVNNNSTEHIIFVSGSFGGFSMPYPELDAIENLKQYALSFGKINKWMKAVAVDGKSGKAYRQRWQVLVDNIKKACECADEYISLSLGKQLSIDESVTLDFVKEAFEEMLPVFAEKGKIGKFTFMLHKNYEQAVAAVDINGAHPGSEEDCTLILKYIELQKQREQCAAIWHDLLVPNDVPVFYDLDRSEPERIAANWIALIEKYLNWYSTNYEPLTDMLSDIGIPSDILFQRDVLDSELIATDKILTCVEYVIPQMCDACISVIKSEECHRSLENLKAVLTSGKRGNSVTCKALVDAIDTGDSSGYAEVYAALEKMYEKYDLQCNRNEALKVLEPVAPQWAEAIRTRAGIHGYCTVPADIDQAWKWKQLSGIIEEIMREPFTELQAESLRLSREYRDVTAKYAEKCGWYYLLRRTEADISLKQALEGWCQTIRLIGRGTGRRVPELRAKARELMVKCQKAVPCWIMPINKALESLDPRYNKFDIIIIDEASQSDISSLAILYMGKKLVIVGDDRQVSPMAIGVEDDKIKSLQEQYIKGKIPNSHLYTAKTSIYDIAKTTFQPLMLREHFRCVPEIIGFSNMLSYEGKIKPLRDASNSVLLPAVVNYRVAGGKRLGYSKTNPKEAETIVALMQACFEQPEYAGKTFGVISLLGDEQVKLIQKEVDEKLKLKDIMGREILCGNSANFQGDERDVIFLSLVDSGTGEGPVHMMNYGPDDSYRKRYNVAVSRARDQLWVIHSLDAANDLKPGDIRKTLIDYSLDPKATETSHAAIEQNAESPFEVAVATALSDRGYHLEQQWKVGSYRLDIVAVCGKKKVAIECDGERWHSGEEKIREDMERQTILERLGWRFIRIRGSEYFRNPEGTIDRVIMKLAEFGIEPEASNIVISENRNTDLLARVKARAAIIMGEDPSSDFESDEETIAAALDPTDIINPLSGNIDTVDTTKEISETRPDPTKGNSNNDDRIESAQISDEEIAAETQSHDKSNERNETETSADIETPEEPLNYGNEENTEEQPEATNDAPIQIVMPGMEDAVPEAEEIIDLLKKNGVKYIDKRSAGGALWIVGGHELDGVVKKAKNLGVNFKFKPEGGKQTKEKPGWWAR